ncbi:hypothetical protein ACFPOI_31340 [Nonomuraea angiospora]|uniref:Vegetative cell wall protein gp1 n=1 Tax=Nonomuraea angiospora TaxID=46172 RepID=A0ABR9LPI4_9ACTN|nr:hypothetical protein [Nonomuraea angiospora]MBE1582330.1 hypothetical protein [Nonomuraea angiospora]
MGGLLAELGKKIADRWFTLLVLPGLLYVAALAAAHALGHAHPFDARRVTDRLETVDADAASAAGLALLGAYLLAAATAGLTAQSLGSLVERLWLAADWAGWPPPLRQLAALRTRGRHRRWTEAVSNYHETREKAAAAHVRARLAANPPIPARPGPALSSPLPSPRELAHRKILRIAAEPPTRPTWMGDRLNDATVRLNRDLGLDLATVWPYLWLTAPDTTRTEIIAARETLTRATTLAGWGLLYLAVAALWWPGLPIAAAVLVTAWRRARTACDMYALLVEATAHLQSADLAHRLGLEPTGPITRETGTALTDLVRTRPPQLDGPVQTVW